MNDELRPLLGGESESYSDRLFSVIMNVVIVVLALVILMHVVVEPVGIIGTSMENGIHDGDTVVLGKLYFSPKRGDVVVIDDGERRIIKRVIAISGDKIGFVREGGDDNYEIALYLDKGYGFVKQNEPYIKEKTDCCIKSRAFSCRCKCSFITHRFSCRCRQSCKCSS